MVADLAAWSTYTRDAVHNTVVTYGALLQTAVKRHASQPRTNPRPSSSPEGPRHLLGTYNRSINRRTTRRANTSTVEVGTNAVQGARLEFGFQGVDAKGRNVNQRAYPHFAPALDEVQPAFEEAVAQVLPPPDVAGPAARARGPEVSQ